MSRKTCGGTMNTYFAWVTKDEPFYSNVHAREDLQIFKLNISQKEGEVALVQLTVFKPDLPPIDQRYAFISCQNERGEIQLLFKGKLVFFPKVMGDESVLLEFSAEPDQSRNQLEKLQESLKVYPYWDELFVHSLDGRHDAIEFLDARSDLYYWDRITGELSLSNLFSGRKTWDLSNEVLKDSLKITLGETPLSEITVNVIAEWTQKAEGHIDVSHKIARHFSGGMINTLTPTDFKNRWPKEGQKISSGRSGYQILRSQIKEINPPKTGILNSYPTVTGALWQVNHKTSEPEAIRLKRSWLKARLLLGWSYRQKRREIASFCLPQNHQLSSGSHRKMRKLNLYLQAITDSHRSSFFNTKRGLMAIDHAIEVAKAYLAGSARCVEIEFEVPFHSILHLTTDHDVVLRGTMIPGGLAKGKVVSYRLSKYGLKSIGWVKLAIAAGVEIINHEIKKEVSYTQDDYCLSTDIFQTPSGIIYQYEKNQAPIPGVAYPQSLTVHDFVKDVVVRFDGAKQCDYLAANQYPVRENLSLAEAPTTLALELLDLRTREVAERQINVEILRGWSAPAQINLS
jgi:hypothetical protein